MSQVASFIRGFVKEQEGATMVEYGIMIALIAAVCAGIIATLGGQVQTAFTNANAGI